MDHLKKAQHLVLCNPRTSILFSLLMKIMFRRLIDHLNSCFQIGLIVKAKKTHSEIWQI